MFLFKICQETYHEWGEECHWLTIISIVLLFRHGKSHSRIHPLAFTCSFIHPGRYCSIVFEWRSCVCQLNALWSVFGKLNNLTLRESIYRSHCTCFSAWYWFTHVKDRGFKIFYFTRLRSPSIISWIILV